MTENASRQETGASRPATKGGPPVTNAVYELFIFALTLVSLLVLVGYWLLSLSTATRAALYDLDILLSLIFLADSIRSLVRAPNKLAYLKWGWLDFAGSIPAVLPLRLVRLARLLRAWRVVRTQHPRQVLREFEEHRAHGALLVTIFAALMVLITASLLVLELENEAPGATIHTGDQAFWWAFGTITTVTYGDCYPVTPLGRIVAMVLMTVGIAIFGVLASYLAAAFITANQVSRKDLDTIQSELASIRADLVAIQALIQAETKNEQGEHP